MTTGRDRKAAHDRRKRMLDRRTPRDAERRQRLESDPAAWLRHYMSGAFPAPWSVAHHEIIDGAVEAATAGTGIAVAAPRGEGKTTLLRGICLYLVATRKARFPVLAGWTHKAAMEGFRVWKRMVSQSPELSADYPELTQPFERSTHAAWLQNLMWSDTEEPCGAEIRAAEKLLVLPSGIGAIAAGSIQADVKGLNVMLTTGEVIRPDLLLIDDAQDPARAGDPQFVAETIETIDSQWVCLAGPQSRLTMMVACTVKATGDVSETLLDRPGIRGIRVARITSWPDGWGDDQSEVRELWDDWNRARLNGLAEHDDGKAGIDFYQKHKKKLTQGMAVSWPDRYDATRGDPDAMYAAMVDFYRVGERAFASEYQNQPIDDAATVYTLTPEIILSRADSRSWMQVPEWSQLTVCGTDLNPSYAFSSAIVAHGAAREAAVVWYGLFKDHPLPILDAMTAEEKSQRLYEALIACGREIAALPCRPEMWLIDAGGSAFDTALRFAARSQELCGIQCMATTGRGHRNYRPWGKNVIGRPGHNMHMAQSVTNRMKWLQFDADYWREVAQSAWLGNVGSPGCVSLPQGSHREFAEQICREQLAGKGEVGDRMVWTWNTLPGPHDYGDAMTMAYVGAGWQGIAPGGAGAPPKAKRKTVSIRQAMARRKDAR